MILLFCVQAQTVANFYLAFDLDLAIVPVLNKIDMDSAEPERVAAQLQDAFDIAPQDCIPCSAKTGQGVPQLLEAIVHQIPHPKGDPTANPRALLFDAFHDEYKGVVCLVKIVDGKLIKGDKVVSCSTGNEWEISELGLLTPDPHPTQELLTGQVGYVLPGMRDARSARVGDTWRLVKKPVVALPGFKPAQSMVFAGNICFKYLKYHQS